jgi:hypothetical protein
MILKEPSLSSIFQNLYTMWQQDKAKPNASAQYIKLRSTLYSSLRALPHELAQPQPRLLPPNTPPCPIPQKDLPGSGK